MLTIVYRSIYILSLKFFTNFIFFKREYKIEFPAGWSHGKNEGSWVKSGTACVNFIIGCDTGEEFYILLLIRTSSGKHCIGRYPLKQLSRFL